MSTSSFIDTDCHAHDLGDGSLVYTGSLPTNLAFNTSQFEVLWNLHPEDYHEISMFGRIVQTPRWQQAYGKDYRFSGQVNRALPVPGLIQPLLQWAQDRIDGALNGALLNWYDGRKGHYIGPHHDDVRDLIPDSPIITISFGQRRIFRLSRDKDKFDVIADPGSVIILTWTTNLVWKHSVPRFKRYQDRRVSVTLRAFG